MRAAFAISVLVACGKAAPPATSGSATPPAPPAPPARTPPSNATMRHVKGGVFDLPQNPVPATIADFDVDIAPAPNRLTIDDAVAYCAKDRKHIVTYSQWVADAQKDPHAVELVVDCLGSMSAGQATIVTRVPDIATCTTATRCWCNYFEVGRSAAPVQQDAAFRGRTYAVRCAR